MTCITETVDPNDPDETARLARIQPKHAYVTIASSPFLDGVIEMVDAQPLRARVKRRTFYRARPQGKAPSHLLASEADARRWIEEHRIGGNPAGFIHELAGRGRRWR